MLPIIPTPPKPPMTEAEFYDLGTTSQLRLLPSLIARLVAGWARQAERPGGPQLARKQRS